MEGAVTDGTLVVGGLKIHCLAAGTAGSPLLLLHGGGIDSASLSYGPSLAPLSEHHRVYAPDWPGYGDSDAPPIEYSTAYYSHFLRQFLDTLGLEKASLVGLSMGGAAAIHFSLRSPERVGRLILVDSYGLGAEAPAHMLSYLMVRLPVLNEAAWMAVRGNRWMVKQSLFGVVHDPDVITDGLVERVWHLVKKPGAGRAWRHYQRVELLWRGLRTNFVDQLHQISMPTLILHGEKDRLVPIRWAERANSLIPGSELAIVPECGHWLPLERPEEFRRAVLAFLPES